MSEKIRWIKNSMLKENGTGVSTELFSKSEIEKAIKDESYRFGLNAFKALGGSYAIGRYLAQRLNKDIRELPFEVLTSPEVKEQLGDITFATTTDGNHGRGIAWTARQLHQKSVVYMPKGSSQYRLEKIREEGAAAEITNMNYDDAVRMTADEAEKNGWIVIQDTSWEGYEEIPSWIMQGYGTMSAEALEELNDLGVEKPTHIFVQAGVGALAGSVQGYFASMFKEDRPKTVIVEANQADCLYKSAQAADGKPRIVGGEMATVMAGLACGEPILIGWNILRDYSDMFVSCPDWVAARGMRVLANPLLGDPKVISGESGAVTAGLLSSMLKDEKFKEAREALGLNEKSQILIFNTEGNTDPYKYRSIVWEGELPSTGK